MSEVYQVKENKQKLLPGITHIDGSGRVQTVKKEENLKYYNLIRNFFELTEVPVILNTSFNSPICPIYQNVTGLPETNADIIRINLNNQLTAPVRWTQTMQNMISDGVNSFTEVGGNGKVLQGLVKKVDRQMETTAI
jgi:malonyl CoA-acyl carrier protein transacylase